MMGVAKKTVMRTPCRSRTDLRNLSRSVFRKLLCRLIQLDELWSFNYCKAKTVTPGIAKKGLGAGVVWLWVVIDTQTELVPCWRSGKILERKLLG